MSRGRIEKALSGFYYVRTPEGLLQCRARGKFRREGISPLVGDWVQVRDLGGDEGFAEMGGGSVRIHQADIQEKMFEVLGFTKEKAQEQFGFLLDAFKYGVPPHAGLAYGMDRMVMLMVGADSIRDVIAFPKVKDASCLMMEAPSQVDPKQLQDLSIGVVESEEAEKTEE